MPILDLYLCWGNCSVKSEGSPEPGVNLSGRLFGKMVYTRHFFLCKYLNHISTKNFLFVTCDNIINIKFVCFFCLYKEVRNFETEILGISVEKSFSLL